MAVKREPSGNCSPPFYVAVIAFHSATRPAAERAAPALAQAPRVGKAHGARKRAQIERAGMRRPAEKAPGTAIAGEALGMSIPRQFSLASSTPQAGAARVQISSHRKSELREALLDESRPCARKMLLRFDLGIAAPARGRFGTEAMRLLELDAIGVDDGAERNSGRHADALRCL
jgi:hypothetical protein